MVTRFIPRSSKARSLLSALAGFIAYGGWAFVANMAHGVEASLKAAATQGSFSFVLTLAMNLIMEWLFQLSHRPRWQAAITICSTCLMVYCASWGINYLAGTPEIFMTVLPGWIFSTIYICMYTATLFRLTTRTDAATDR